MPDPSKKILHFPHGIFSLVEKKMKSSFESPHLAPGSALGNMPPHEIHLLTVPWQNICLLLELSINVDPQAPIRGAQSESAFTKMPGETGFHIKVGEALL